MLNVAWVKSSTGNWLRLDQPIGGLSNITTVGVYVIWHGGQTPRTVRVGQGQICDRLPAHVNDAEIKKFTAYGLYVTWAAVPAAHLDGVERFLGDRLNPLVGDRFPYAVPVVVNLPWAA